MNTSFVFSEKDYDQLTERGLTKENVFSQLRRFQTGFSPVEIVAPATNGNGILKLSTEELDSYITVYENADIDVMKFVPASGAASRMFKKLFLFHEKNDGTPETINALLREYKSIGKFFTELETFSFYAELDKMVFQKNGISIKEAKKEYKHNVIVEALLSESGMNYGNIPKGLISFHKYDEGVRSAVQEHLAEGLDYADKRGKVQIHFTVSQDYKDDFEKHVADSITKLAVQPDVCASFSVQYPHTDTIATTFEFDPIRDENGDLLFRPAGHGALLANLNDLSADLIYIKNIDNVVPDRLRGEGVKYKKTLAGILLDMQAKTFDLLKKSEAGVPILEEGNKLLSEMGTIGDFSEAEVVSLLDRPIRVCGMVKNEGEPGGGPFWVKGKNSQSLQIVESAQIDKEDKTQQSIFNSGTHFNPVDIVCGVKDYKGEKFNLLDFRDEEAGFISEKSYNGNKLLAMELPGLWNGGMADWNTIFVEVPLITFNPVKTVTDLLATAHR